MDAPITDWICEKQIGTESCHKIINDTKEYQILIHDNKQILLFFPKDLDTSKLHSYDTFVVAGQIVTTGWPSWFPIFNRKTYYRFSYPFKKDVKP